MKAGRSLGWLMVWELKEAASQGWEGSIPRTLRRKTSGKPALSREAAGEGSTRLGRPLCLF